MFKVKLFFFNTITILGFSQSDIKLSNYNFSPLLINPAYATAYNGIAVSNLYSNQWLGFDGAPKTVFLSTQARLNNSVGVGIDLLNDKLGVTEKLNIGFNFAYKLLLNENWNLALGLKVNYISHSIDYTLLKITNPNEFQGWPDKNMSLNLSAGAGFYLYNQNTFLGLGIPKLTNNKYTDIYNNVLAKSNENIFVMLGQIFEINDELKLTTSLLTYFSTQTKISNVIASNLNFKDKFIFNLNTELGASFGGFFGYQILDKYLIGYSLDFSINKFVKYNLYG